MSGGSDSLDLDQPFRAADRAVNHEHRQIGEALGEIATDAGEIGGIAQIDGEVHHLLEAAGVHPYRVWIGEYATSLEMAGASLSLLRLDAELKTLVDAPAQSPFFVQR